MDQGNIEIQAMKMRLSTNNRLADRKRVMHFKRTPFYSRQFVSFCNAYNAKVLNVLIDAEGRFEGEMNKIKTKSALYNMFKRKSYSFPTLI
jgi:hypothetical protein